MSKVALLNQISDKQKVIFVVISLVLIFNVRPKFKCIFSLSTFPDLAQPVFTFSKLAIETLEQGGKYIQS